MRGAMTALACTWILLAGGSVPRKRGDAVTSPMCAASYTRTRTARARCISALHRASMLLT